MTTSSPIVKNIWNPFHQEQHLHPVKEQDAPLDLSMKGNYYNNSQVVKKREADSIAVFDESINRNFDFKKFYSTYYAISARSWEQFPMMNQGGYSAGSVINNEEQELKKRKLDSSICELDESVSSGDEKRIKLEDEGEGKRKAETNINNNKKKVAKNSRTTKNVQISRIKDSCDCRFCYEDHIMKMRLKTERSWLSLLG